MLGPWLGLAFSSVAYADVTPNTMASSAPNDSDSCPEQHGDPWLPIERNRVETLADKGVALCCCAKCGTTSLNRWVYEVITGKEWPYTGPPWVHSHGTARWPDGTWRDQAKPHSLAGLYSVAFVREPVGRLLSAYQDKLVNGRRASRKAYACQLVALEGRNRALNSDGILSLNDFADAIKNVHADGKQTQLNQHFRPQTDGCFVNNTVSEWSRVVEITNTTMLDELGQHIGAHTARLLRGGAPPPPPPPPLTHPLKHHPPVPTSHGPPHLRATPQQPPHTPTRHRPPPHADPPRSYNLPHCPPV